MMKSTLKELLEYEDIKEMIRDIVRNDSEFRKELIAEAVDEVVCNVEISSNGNLVHWNS